MTSRPWKWPLQGAVAVLAVLTALSSAVGAEVGPLVERIRAVGGEGAGNAAAARAWRELVRLGPGALPEILAGLDGADAIAANWLRAAVDAIAERGLRAGHKLPAERLEAFVRQTRRSGPARRLAYEWLARVDPSAPGRLLPGMLHDPGTELRRDAVDLVLREAQERLAGGDRPAATAAYRKALSGARDRDQVDRIARRLKDLGVEVDLAAHFGFLRKWMLLGPFDNRGGAGFNTAFAPEKGVELARTYEGKGEAKLHWLEHTTTDPYGVVDLNKALGKHTGATAYAFAVVHAPAERPVEVRAGSENAVKIFLNGRLIFSREEYHHGMRMDQHVGRGKLRAGRNEVLVKVCQNEQPEAWARAWSFQLRVCDPAGGKVPRHDCGLRIADCGLKKADFSPGIRNPQSAIRNRKAGDWPQFRGPGGTGVADETGVPTRWGPDENIRWKADLPGRGISSPVVARGKVYVTACTGPLQDRLHVLCFDTATGKRLWERQLWATGNTFCHPKTCMAAPTPATDGERVYALFATGDLVCLDADGNLLWYRALARDYPHISNQVGMAASPVLWQDVLLVPMETADDSFAAGLDKLTGRNRWKVRRPREINWVTPLLIRNHGRDEALFLSSGELTAYDPRTGRKYWSYSGEGLSSTPSVPSPAACDDFIVTGSGVALRLGGAAPERVWRANKLKPAYASPLCYQGRVYAVNNTGVLINCFDVTDGKVLWQQRIKGPVSASPVAAGGKIYLVNEEGVTTVVEAGARPRVLRTNRLGETILATPAVAGGALFLRSDQHLYCIARGQAEGQGG